MIPDRSYTGWDELVDFKSMHQTTRGGYVQLGLPSSDSSTAFSFSAGGCNAMDHYFFTLFSPDWKEGKNYRNGAIVSIAGDSIGIMKYYETPMILSLVNREKNGKNLLVNGGTYIPPLLDSVDANHLIYPDSWDFFNIQAMNMFPCRYLLQTYAKTGTSLQTLIEAEKERIHSELGLVFK